MLSVDTFIAIMSLVITSLALGISLANTITKK